MSLINKICEKHQEALRKYIEEIGLVGVAVIDGEKKVIECNPRFAEMTGDKDPVGHTLDDLVSTTTGKPISLPPPDSAWNSSLIMKKGNPWERECLFYVFHDKGDFILFAGQPKHPDEKYMVELSKLNAELTDLTRQLKKKQIELERANIKIIELARTDALTGLANRRFFNEMMEKDLAMAARHNMSLAFAMADLDHFKRINDDYGHAIGDKVLIAFSELLHNTCRRTDMAARWGGEEFVIMMQNTTAAQAGEMAERLRQATECYRWQDIDASITVSIGITQFRDGDTEDSLAARADEALYRAKAMGRNRVVSL